MHRRNQERGRARMEKVEWPGPRIAEPVLAEKADYLPAEESSFVGRVLQPAPDRLDVLLHRDLRVEHVRFEEEESAARLEHAPELWQRAAQIKVMKHRLADHRVEVFVPELQVIHIPNLHRGLGECRQTTARDLNLLGRDLHADYRRARGRDPQRELSVNGAGLENDTAKPELRAADRD